MIINHNIPALNTYRQLGINSENQSKSMEKLSSGLRINRAGDDAAGLAISEKMRGQIRGLDQASRNSQDAISMISTAEGALNETHSILQRMRELAVQSANDTNTDQDRQNIQDETDQLGKEIDRISSTTQFNTKNLLDGSMDKGTTAASNVNTNKALDAASSTSAATAITLADVNGNNLGIVSGDTIEVSWVKNGTTTTNTVNVVAATTIDNIMSGNTDGAAVFSGANGISFTATATGYIGAVNGMTITVKDSSGNVKSAATNALSSFTETTQAEITHADGQASRIVAMSFCEPRSCRLQLSS